MGKGTIITHIEDGKYNLTVNYYRDQFAKIIEALDKNIASLTTKIYTELQAGTEQYNVAKLQRSALQKEKQRLESAFPEDEETTVWCADLTKDLTDVVATIEVPGEHTIIQIAPGFKDRAAYDSANHGQLVPTVTQTAAQTFYNLAMLPGWQKWMPTFRHGEISDIDTDNDLCTVTLEAATSSQQSLDVNQAAILTSVPVEYMSCNASAFEDGDLVLVKFEGQKFDSPKVIGFKENPKSCAEPVTLMIIEFNENNIGGVGSRMRLVWDVGLAAPAILFDDDDIQITYPCTSAELTQGVNNLAAANGQTAVVEATTDFNFDNRALHWAFVGYDCQFFSDSQTWPDQYGLGGTVTCDYELLEDSSTIVGVIKTTVYEEKSDNNQSYDGEVQFGPNAGNDISVLFDRYQKVYKREQFGPYLVLESYKEQTGAYHTLFGSVHYENHSDFTTSPATHTGQDISLFSVISTQSEHCMAQFNTFIKRPHQDNSSAIDEVVSIVTCNHFNGDGMVVGDPITQARNTDLEDELNRVILEIKELKGEWFDFEYDILTVHLS